jgi:FMN phosphatase YigB (HAD superfamily)
LRRYWADSNLDVPPGVDRYGMYPGGEGEYWLRVVEGTLARTARAPRDPAFAARAIGPLRDAFRDPSSWLVHDDVVPALSALRDAGAKLAIVSNWDSGLPALLTRLGLAGWFDAIVVSHLEGMEKPRPELFLRAVERLNGAPGDALHVGDVPGLDELGARAAGIASVIVDRRFRPPAARHALADLSSLPAIARSGRIEPADVSPSPPEPSGSPAS